MWFGLDRLFGKKTEVFNIPESTWLEIEAKLPFLAHLPSPDRVALRDLALQFINRKVFWGAHDFEPDNHVRLSIALQACLPILKLGIASYDGWSGIVVYPGDFVVPRRVIDENGLLHEYTEDALGESWEGGPVILSWFDDPAGYGGANVVIHEFAHKLDMLNGEADGVPPLHAGMNYDEWINCLDTAYDDFCERVDFDRDIADIDDYASEHPAEFFAVMSEVFFTRPQVLQALYPTFYSQLVLFYRQDPVSR